MKALQERLQHACERVAELEQQLTGSQTRLDQTTTQLAEREEQIQQVSHSLPCWLTSLLDPSQDSHIDVVVGNRGAASALCLLAHSEIMSSALSAVWPFKIIASWAEMAVPLFSVTSVIGINLVTNTQRERY